ncbi:MAG: DNA/RNA nuclease SfsA [Desulfoprunum sp.]
MRFSDPLIPAVLLKRYQRFLVDVQLPDGRTITAHCPNTGAMRSCSTPGSPVRLSQSANPRRKHRFSLEMVQANGTWVGVNTARTNSIVVEAIERGIVREMADPEHMKKEVGTSAGCRLDLAVIHGSSTTFVEIKCCTYVDQGWAMFPDAVTTRGTKHLLELRDLVRRGDNGAVLFLVQRTDAVRFRPAAAIDPLYARTLEAVHAEGVAILVYQALITPEEIAVTHSLPFSFT